MCRFTSSCHSHGAELHVWLTSVSSRAPARACSRDTVISAPVGFVWGAVFPAVFVFLSHPDFFSPSFWRALDFFPFLVVFGRSAAVRPWRRLSCHLSSAGSFRSHITASPLAAARCWLVRTTYWQPNKGISQQLSHMMNHVSLPPSPHILSATVICHISLVGYFICSFIKETAECGNGFYPPPHTDWTLAFDSATRVLIFKRLILVWTLSLAQKKTCGKLFLLFQYVFLLLKPVLNLEKGCLNTRLPLLGLG